MISKHLLNQRFIPSNLKEARCSYLERSAKASYKKSSLVGLRSDYEFIQALFEKEDGKSNLKKKMDYSLKEQGY